MNNAIVEFLIGGNDIVFQLFGVYDKLNHLYENLASHMEKMLVFVHRFKKVSGRPGSSHTKVAKKYSSKITK